jgi:hypothetical protein
MCSDHRRGYRMIRTVATPPSPGGGTPVPGVRCIGNVRGEGCTHDNGGPAWAVVDLEGRAVCAHHRRGYRAQLTNSGSGWAGEPPTGGRVLYAVLANERPMVKIGKAMSSTLAVRTNAAWISAGEIKCTTRLVAKAPIRDRADRGATGPLSLSYEHAVRLVIATALGGRFGAHKTEWVEVPPERIDGLDWQALLENAIAWVESQLLPIEGGGCDLLREHLVPGSTKA